MNEAAVSGNGVPVVPRASRVVVITSDAPYLGGPLTWAALRASALEFEFVEIDTLAFADAPDIGAAVEDALTAVLRDADAAIAHSSAARPVIQAVSRVRPDMPVLLLSPMLLTRDAPHVRLVRAVLRHTFVARLLRNYARSKHRRLLTDRDYVTKQLNLLVRSDRITGALIDEAQARIRDPRTADAVERTVDVLTFSLTPVDTAANVRVRNRLALIGPGILERKTAKRMTCTVLPSATRSPMIETPDDVARALRSLLAS
ncbi:MAG: hypothetical protein JWM87_4856 [Candidatus Eremiobacteraeota bacterium]|nr:hypothetical protein [Candidatus Eremiobacteraeota bacterium]